MACKGQQGLERLGGWPGDRVRPLLTRSPSLVQMDHHPTAAPGWPAPTARPPILPARVLPASAPPELRWKTAHKLKEISFQQTPLRRSEPYLPLPERVLFISLPKIKLKNLNHKLKNRWGHFRIWLELVEELIRSSRLPGNSREPMRRGAGRSAQHLRGIPLPPKKAAGHQQA